MSITSELSRLQEARDDLAEKIPATGLISTYADQLQTIINNANAITDGGSTTIADAMDVLIAGYGHGGETYEEYTGVYEITPSTSEQVLPTAQKVLTADVTVQEIPYYETTNESGGYTVIIG